MGRRVDLVRGRARVRGRVRGRGRGRVRGRRVDGGGTGGDDLSR